MPSTPAYNIEDVIALAKQAGAEIMRLRPSVIANPDIKGDGSPVTLADKTASDIVIKGLGALTPHISVVSEERADSENRAIQKNNSTYWIVDPLDGTRSYIDGFDGFGVHIGLIENGVPVAGIIYFPALDLTYYTDGANGAFRREGNKPAVKLALSPEVASTQAPRVTVSWKRNKRPDKSGGNYTDIPEVGGARVVAVAEGRVDLALIESPFSYWDIAAAHALLRAAGGELYDLKTGLPTRYPPDRLDIAPAIGGRAGSVANHRARFERGVAALDKSPRGVFKPKR
jgi:3'(2'), 5'-bisphosphate nucleotidase